MCACVYVCVCMWVYVCVCVPVCVYTAAAVHGMHNHSDPKGQWVQTVSLNADSEHVYNVRSSYHLYTYIRLLIYLH